MKRYIRSFTASELKSRLGDNYPKDGYLYIFKHGIGPGTIPSDVTVVKTKDLPNYYTAVWLDRFLTTEELKRYDIPDETRINSLLDRIGYCQKNGDVVPCNDIKASTDISDDKVKFFYKGKFLGSCDPDYMECDALRDVMHSDMELSSLVLEYLNSLGDPVFPVSEEDYSTSETDISKVDIDDLYNTFMQELDYEYRDFPEEFYVDLSVPRSGVHSLEIFTGAVAEGVDLNACDDIKCSTEITAATNYDTKLIAKWLKAKFDDEAFGTAYTMHKISDADAYMSRNGLTYNRKNNTIDLWKSGGEEDIPIFKVVPQYSSTKRQGTYAPKMPKLIPIDEWNATHGDY